eukprot:EG_transcript_24236
MNGTPVDGNNLLVKLADRDRGSAHAIPGLNSLVPPSAPSMPSDNVFVGNLPPEWTEAELNGVFGTCGAIVTSVVLSDKATGRSKGAGMVRFSDVQAAAYAVSTLNGFVVEGTGKALVVKFADRPEEKGARLAMKQVVGLQQARFSPYGHPAAHLANGAGLLRGIPAALPMLQQEAMPQRVDIVPEEGANLHIFGLAPTVTDLNLYQAFGGYGAIRSVRVISDPATKQPKGYGFVQFFAVQDALSAMAALNGLTIHGRPWSISIHKKKA